MNAGHVCSLFVDLQHAGSRILSSGLVAFYLTITNSTVFLIVLYLYINAKIFLLLVSNVDISDSKWSSEGFMV